MAADPNILQPGNFANQPGISQQGQSEAQLRMMLDKSFRGIADALQKGMDVGPFMQDLAIVKGRNEQLFVTATKTYSGAAKSFINNLDGVSLAMNAAARMSERAQNDLKAKAADYCRAFKDMGVVGKQAAEQGQAAILTGFGSAINEFVQRIREIEVLGLTGEQKEIATRQVKTRRDKAMAGNINQAELSMAGGAKSQQAFAAAIGGAMKDAVKISSGVGGGGIMDLMKKGGSMNRAIAESVGSGKGLLARTAANEITPDKNGKAALGMGLLSKTLGSMPAMLKQLIGYAGQFTSVAMSWGLIVKMLTEGVGAWDFFRKMEGIGVSMSVNSMKGMNKSYTDVSQAIEYKTRATRWDLMATGKAREIEAEAAATLGKSGLAGAAEVSADKIGEMTDELMRAAVTGAEFQMSVSESIAMAIKLQKAFGAESVNDNMRQMLKGANMIGMSFEDVASSLGDVVNLSMKFGQENAKNAALGAMAAVSGLKEWTEKTAVLKAFQSLLNAPLTYKAGLVMGANMANPDAALGGMYRPGKGGVMGVLGSAVGYYANIMDKSMANSGLGENMKALAKGTLYGNLYQNPAIAETYAFLSGDRAKRAEFDTALSTGNKKRIDEFINLAEAKPTAERGLDAMKKQVMVLEKILVTLTSGFQWVLDAIPGGGKQGNAFVDNSTFNSAEFRGLS